MRAYDIIIKKRNGESLTKDEIDFIVENYNKGSLPDYQMAAFTMAAFIKGLEPMETVWFTMAMVNSGEQLDLSDVKGVKVDKHSTGGVGDKTTLILGPIAAAAGVRVAKISGRGLGHTGGTLDKLESIPGFNINISGSDFIDGVNKYGIVVAGQTENLVPADKKLYALRDVTGTVDNIPLIAASIMSKKIASGADAIVLDVKTGNGAFMKTVEDSIKLAKTMVEIGSRVGRKTIAVVTSNEQPLGHAVGNALEVKEAIETLKGNGPEDLVELCSILAAQMIRLAGESKDMEEGRLKALKTISDGTALEKFRQMISNQHGDRRVIDDLDILPKATKIIDVHAPQNGYVHSIDAEQIGIAAMMVGAGRELKEDKIDYGSGVVLCHKVGDKVTKGDVIAQLHTSNDCRVKEATERILNAYCVKSEPKEKEPLIYAMVDSDGTKIV